MWATPGSYLRKSMLATLAKKASDHFLPEVFYKTAFDTSPHCASRPPDEEEAGASGIATDIRRHWATTGEDPEGESDEEGDY